MLSLARTFLTDCFPPQSLQLHLVAFFTWWTWNVLQL